MTDFSPISESPCFLKFDGVHSRYCPNTTSFLFNKSFTKLCSLHRLSPMLFLSCWRISSEDWISRGSIWKARKPEHPGSFQQGSYIQGTGCRGEGLEEPREGLEPRQARAEPRARLFGCGCIGSWGHRGTRRPVRWELEPRGPPQRCPVKPPGSRQVSAFLPPRSGENTVDLERSPGARI